MLPRSRVHQTERSTTDRTSTRGASRQDEKAEDAAVTTAPGVRRFLIVLALLGSIQLAIMIGVEAYRAVEGQRAIERLERDIAALDAEAAGLAAVVEHADDAAYREQLARRRGFVAPDEVRIVPLR